MSDETVLYGTPPPEEPPKPTYPVRLSIDAPPEVGRLSSIFRIILLIPVAIALYAAAGAAVVSFHWITVLVRGRPVDWVFDVIVAVQRFSLRIFAYALLTTDRYPPFDGDSAISYEVARPERIQRKQLLFWKTFASIPHLLVLIVLWFAVVVCVVIAWFAILFTGRFPLGLRGFVIGWLRWVARVSAYWMSLTDEFPPFSLSEDAGPATSTSHVVSGVGGFVLTGGVAAGIVVALLATATTERADVSYAGLLEGSPSETLEVINVQVTLLGAIDPYEFPDELFVPEEGRFVALGVDLFNTRGVDQVISEGHFDLKDSDGDHHDPFVVSVDGVPAPADLDGLDGVTVVVIFEVPEGEDPEEFKYEPQFLQKAKFEFTE